MHDTRHLFARKLNEVNERILKMGTLVEEAIRKAITALTTKDMDLARKVMSDDDQIDRLEVEINDKCVALIATEQPVAGDLRRIMTGIKIAAELERMGDHASHIARSALRLADETLMKKLIDIPRMAEVAAAMIHDVLTAFINSDVSKAQEVAGRDDEIDTLHDQVVREVMTYMMENSKNIRQAIEFLFQARYLERLGDHVTNICEWICFDKTGEHPELNP